MNRRGEAARRVDRPEPGFFEVRLVKGGPLVAASIAFDVDTGMWTATIDGDAGLPDPDPWQAEGLTRVWHYGRAVTEDEYRYRLALKTWALANDPAHPAAHPRDPINVNTLATPF